MAWIEKRRRSDGGTSARVVWRLGGFREGARQVETFAAGSDEQNLLRAEGFRKMVDAAGQRWPEGWVKGEGFVRPVASADPLRPTPRFDDLGEEYVRQIVDLSPGQRKRYLGHIRVLAELSVRGRLLFTRPVSAIGSADLKEWLIDWDRSLKTKANYHGLIHGVFAYAVDQGHLAANPAIGTAPRMSRVKQSRPELRFLTEAELRRAVSLAGPFGDLLTVAVGTGLRFGELGALWVGDVDLERRTIRVTKAWKRNGEADATEIPGWLARQLTAKHTMREHHLGVPKTAKSRRTITISPSLVTVLRPHVEGRAADDFVFTSNKGYPLHNADFATHVWRKLMKALEAEGVPRFRFHDLRHTHVAWLVAGGAPLPHIQARLGHESITTTIDTYGHLLPVGDELISGIIDTALSGETIRPKGQA
ncbi:site-specific integrase [Nocardioides sp. GY 10113]|uniref:tyrosine-type recombinase/integrase n=1 Tax=Nocardioides sp. GY 10113 TaxID=2569761 RepID=UPI0010A9268C|nr:site-specific integrase [Nocardioides sp. GY 10113]TIC89099.1 site-specific integrase [Nocardioides sp. GY 10113]